MEFTPFPKIPRLSRDIVITEKIDGTNASILIHPSPVGVVPEGPFIASRFAKDEAGEDIVLVMRAGSRTRWITPQDDNYGFARWAQEHADELFELGEGHHFGEWWGSGIQRGYGLPKGEKRFSLFNTGRWYDRHTVGEVANVEGLVAAPACCHVVPVLYRGRFSDDAVQDQIDLLVDSGSVAAPGFHDPEGIVVWHEAARQMFKKTLKKDELPKALAAA